METHQQFRPSKSPGDLSRTQAFSRPKKFRAIFAEIKGTLNHRVSDQFVAESAQSLLELFEDEKSFARRKFNGVAPKYQGEYQASDRLKSLGKCVARSRGIDKWNREAETSDLRWQVCADLDIPSEEGLSLDAQLRLEKILNSF